jgi:hypothetical protein
LIAMQRVLKARVDDPETEPKDQASCARAWRDLQEQIRVLRGQPLPGMLRPESNGKRKGRGKGAEAGVKEAANKPQDPPAPIVLPPANEPQPVVVPDVAASK